MHPQKHSLCQEDVIDGEQCSKQGKDDPYWYHADLQKDSGDDSSDDGDDSSDDGVDSSDDGVDSSDDGDGDDNDDDDG